MRTTSAPVLRRSVVSVLAVLVLVSLTLATAGASPAPQATPTDSGFSRPQIVLVTYWASEAVHPGESFTLEFRLGNVGGVKARNVVVNVSSGDFIPAGKGGVIAAGAISAGADTGYQQRLVASSTLEEGSIGTLTMLVSYTDPAEEAYSDSFTLAIPVAKAKAVSYSGPVATATPIVRPQLVITDYSTDIEPLRPGRQFVLAIRAVNVGGAAGRGVSLIVGGGTASGSGGGTPEPGGIAGGSGSFETFAPIGASNVQYLGDFAVGGERDLQQRLIVNTTANPGAYPLKISFVYQDSAGASYTDDQVITLLVYSPPVIEISFYQPPEVFFAGQPGMLPLQVVNLDRKSVVLGRMQASAEAGELSNNVLPIGLIDAGGYFTLDAMYIPETVGAVEITVTVDYLDDFGEAQRITQTLPIEVMELEEGMPGEAGGGQGGIPTEPPMPEPETFWQKVVRFFKGLLGLDSGTQVPEIEEVIPEESPPGIIVPKG